MTCPSCGNALPERARFCPACGHAVGAPGARGDERRIVTVVFADLVGFTSLSEAMDPEQVKYLVDVCMERLAGDVTAFGGRVDKIVGDAIVALFGAPVAHEDDAERAVRAALQMQQSVVVLSGEVGSVRLRIGVNTGEVLVGALRAGGDYTAMGDVVNVASRLQTMAEPGHVLVGSATRAGTAGVVRYETAGCLQPRGRDLPVEAWTAVECLAPPGQRPARADGPLVGRTEELGLLQHAVGAAVLRRRAQLLVLLGEAGVGKSRLVRELQDWVVQEHDATVLEGRCVPYGEANVWWPMAEMLRQACRIEPSDDGEETLAKCLAAVASVTGLDADSSDAERVASGLAYLMGNEDALADVDPARTRDEVRVALLNFLEGLARRRPLVIALSEIHWADELVFDAIDELLDRLHHLPLVLVATARPEVEPRWSPRPGRHSEVVLHIDPLALAEGRQLLESLSGDGLEAGLGDALLERSGGNPLFLEELTALLDEARRNEANLLETTGASGMELPATLRGLVAARLDVLSPHERAVVEDASVVGVRGRLEALDTLAAARGAPEIGSVVEELTAKDVMTTQGDTWVFRSGLAREVAYEILTKADRARRHYALASWLSERTQRADREHEVVEQLAHHYGEATTLTAEVGAVVGVPDDVWRSALTYTMRSAERSRHRGLYRVAVDWLDRAVAVVPPGAEDARRQALLERADVNAYIRQPGAARPDLDAALASASRDGDERDLARAATVLGHVELVEGSLEPSSATLDRAVRMWRALGDDHGEAEALSHRGMTLFAAGDTQGAEAAMTTALEAFRSLGSRREEAWALWNLAEMAYVGGQLTVAEERLGQAGEAFWEAGDFGGIGWAKGLLGFVRFFQGRREEAEQLATHILGEVREGGDRWALAMVQLLLSSVAMWQGRTSEAIERGRTASRLFADLEDSDRVRADGALSRALVAAGDVQAGIALARENLSNALSQRDDQSPVFKTGHVYGLIQVAGLSLAGTAVHMGDGELALAALHQVYETPAHEVLDTGEPEPEAAHGAVLVQSGQFEEAVERLERASSGAVAPGPRANALSLLALAHAAALAPEQAIDAAEAVAALVEATYLDRAIADIGKGFAHVQLGYADEARSAFDDALSTLDVTGDRVQQATTRLALARALEAMEQPAASTALADAQGMLDDMGITAEGWDTAFRAAAGLGVQSLPTAGRH
jgi:class 3 adenylate cyclase/tetratricopeptide (TPR) repeat protein